MTDEELKEMVQAFYEASKDMIEKDIGALESIQISPHAVTFHGHKDKRIFHKETLKKDLLWLNEEGKKRAH